MKINNFVTLLRNHKVVIPPIQRDYAQGRNTGKVKRIRDKFLETMSDVLSDDYTGEPLKLDFIYGYINTDHSESGQEFSLFKPLDGQQRLTTLFLLHWFIAIRLNKLDSETKSILANFSYATRSKSRQFCQRLVKFHPTVGAVPLKDQIENQPWFFMSWASDPTIASMLVVLDAMETKFSGKDISGAWEKLVDPDSPIIFYLLEMKDLGLPDDLYIKMNSRGKELTEFEHFKSQFSRILSDQNAKIFKRKIDNAWSDLFWDIFKEDESKDLALRVDMGFLNFFWYITDLLIVKNNIQVNEDEYWLTIIESVYSINEKAEDNVSFLFACLNLFTALETNDPAFFRSHFYKETSQFEVGKTRLFFANTEINLFHKCVRQYATSKRVNPFSVGEQLMLYACIIHKLENTENFNRIIRVIRNLIASSEDQIRKEYLKTLYADIEDLVKNRPLSAESRFSKNQAQEELVKLKLCTDAPELRDVVYKLEDHHLLRGTLSVFNLDDSIKPYAEKFQEVFTVNCDYHQISRGMLALGDYSQSYGNLRRLGSHLDSTWRELFTPNEYRKNFDATKQVLQSYLDQRIRHTTTNNNDLDLDWSSLEKDWRYYYIRYENFRQWNGNTTEGFYYWEDFGTAPFNFTMMYRKQFNGRHWNPFLLEISTQNKNCSIENYGNDVQFTLGDNILNIRMDNNSFIFEAGEQDSYSATFLAELKKVRILNSDGRLELKQLNAQVDAEDRIEACLDILTKIEMAATTKGGM